MLRRLFHIVLILLLLSACGHRSQEMSEALLRAEEMNRNYQSMDTLKGRAVFTATGAMPPWHYIIIRKPSARPIPPMPIATSIPFAAFMDKLQYFFKNNVPPNWNWRLNAMPMTQP